MYSYITCGQASSLTSCTSWNVQAKIKGNDVNGSAMDPILSDRLSHSPSITNKEASVGWKGWPQISFTTFFWWSSSSRYATLQLQINVKQTETQPVFQLGLFHTITLCLSFTDTSTCHWQKNDFYLVLSVSQWPCTNKFKNWHEKSPKSKCCVWRRWHCGHLQLCPRALQCHDQILGSLGIFCTRSTSLYT